MTKLLLEKEYRRKDGSMFFCFHKLSPTITVDGNGVLVVTIKDEQHNFDLKKDTVGYIYSSTDLNPIMCHAIKSLMDKGYYPIKVIVEHNHTTEYFVATPEMEFDKIEKKFMEVTKK